MISKRNERRFQPPSKSALELYQEGMKKSMYVIMRDARVAEHSKWFDKEWQNLEVASTARSPARFGAEGLSTFS